MDTIFYKINGKADHDDISEERVEYLIRQITPENCATAVDSPELEPIKSASKT
jgi:hypothetical protein